MTFEEDRQRLDLAMSSSRLGLWDWNMITGETVFNDRWAEIIGYSLEDLQPTTIDTWIEYCHPDDLERSNAAIEAHINGEADFYDVELRMRHKDGHWVWVHDRGRIVERTDDGTPSRMVGTHDDISERMEIEQRLRLAAVVFENSLEGVLTTDSDFQISAANPAFTAITGWSANAVTGRDVVFLFESEMAPERLDRLRDLARNPGGIRVEVSLSCVDGTVKPVLLSTNVVPGERAEVAGFVCQISDLSEAKAAEQSRLEWVRSYDSTTQLPNRHRFLADLQQDITSRGRSRRSGAVVLVNFDQFRRIVDAFGFPASEELVREVAERLRGLVDPEDVVARLAGDEFGFYLPGMSDPASAERFAQGLLAAVHEVRHIPNDGEVFLTASAGVALVSPDTHSATELLQRAAAGLHVAKERGPGSVGFPEDEFVDVVRQRLALLTEMREGWINGEFRVEYQPTLSVRTSAVSGAEALMRWTSPTLGEVSPGKFIPLAEDAGLIESFGTWTLQQACIVGADLLNEGVADFRMSVNISVIQLRSESFASVVREALEGSGFPAEHLYLEVTESTFMEASEALAAVFAEITGMGVRFSIDDFGTGYSSFAYLARYPVDELKIDSSFIAGLGTGTGSQAIVAAIIDMAHHLGIKVVAEGVETREQLVVLQALECDFFQGFLESPAIQADEFRRAYA